MNLLVLFVSSFVWGAMLWGGAMLAQRYGQADGAARQVIWRLAAILLIAPWIIAPIGVALGMTGPAAAPEPAINSVELTALPAWTSVEAAGPAAAVPKLALPNISWPALLAIIVALGWTVRIIAARRAKATLGRILSGASPAGDGPARRSVQRWKQRLGLKAAPALRLIDANVSPFSYGVRRPVIVTPRELEQRLRPDALDLVVGHECLHIARGDGWVRPLERVVADVLWFNPFAWLIRRELDFARELACDEAVLAHVSHPEAYARTLRDVASMTAGLSVQSPAAAMSLAGGGRMMMKRVKGAMGYANGRPAWSALVAAGGLALLGAPVAIAQAVLAAPPPPPHVGTPPAPAAPPSPDYRFTVTDDGDVTAPFAAKVIMITRSLNGMDMSLSQTAPKNGKTCTAVIAGLSKVSVNANQVVAEGEVLGVPSKNHRLSITCNGGSTPPAPPAVPTPATFEGTTFHLWFPGKVEKLASGPDGVNFVIVQTEDYRGERGCTLRAAGFKTASIKQGDKVEGGAAIGTVGKHTTTNVKCEGKAQWNNFVDGKPRGPDVPAAPPAPPAIPPTPTGYIQPVAPVAPVAPLPPLAPMKPLHALSPMPAKLEAPRPVPAPAPQPIPEPQAVPAVPAAPPVAPAPRTRQVPEVSPVPPVAPVPQMPRNPKPISWASRAVLDAGRITSPFGQRVDPMTNKAGVWHDGVDIAAPMGAAIHTPGAGSVTFAGLRPGYASVVEIAYPDGAVMRYAHLQDFSVRAGQTVNAGDVIGRVGTDENSTGPHLHFEILEGGVTQDAQKIGGLVLIGK